MNANASRRPAKIRIPNGEKDGGRQGSDTVRKGFFVRREDSEIAPQFASGADFRSV